jgi:hypothetical protein
MSGQDSVVWQEGHVPVVGNSTSGWSRKNLCAQHNMWPFLLHDFFRHCKRSSSYAQTQRVSNTLTGSEECKRSSPPSSRFYTSNKPPHLDPTCPLKMLGHLPSRLSPHLRLRHCPSLTASRCPSLRGLCDQSCVSTNCLCLCLFRPCIVPRELT